MDRLAARLMGRKENAPAALPTAIFGTVGAVNHALLNNTASVRIGLWPIISHTEPAVSMGIGIILSHLLERYRDVRVYRLLAQVGNNPDTYQWRIQDSQFGVDDWQLEDLDDNVGIWGELDGGTLTLHIESDLATAEDLSEPVDLTYTGNNLGDLVGQLADIAAGITDVIGVSEMRALSPGYAADRWDNALLKSVCEMLFDWERRLYLFLWGQVWAEADIRPAAIAIIQASGQLDDLGDWLVGQTLARAIKATDGLLDVSLWLSLIKDLRNPISIALVSDALYRMQHTSEAYDLIDSALEDDPENAFIYSAAAELYRRGGRIQEAVDVFQTAIENDFADAELYQKYAELLIAVDYNDIEIEAVVMVDPDDVSDSVILWEAVESYQAALELSPENTDILLQLLIQLISLNPDDERLWSGLEYLASQESASEQTRTVIDAMHNVPDLDPLIKILQDALSHNPQRMDLYTSLGAAYLLDENYRAAENILRQGRSLAGTPDDIRDIERLLLSVEDPDFEMRFGEITDIINAGNSVSAEDADFLEELLEKAPSFTEAAVLLARVYLRWDETAAALETLLDGHNRTPDDLEIIALLSETLWESGQEDLAFSYLNKGLSTNTSNVPLLALAGKFLFENGQKDAARMYLLKAEMIAPRDPVLVQIRQHIGRAYMD